MTLGEMLHPKKQYSYITTDNLKQIETLIFNNYVCANFNGTWQVYRGRSGKLLYSLTNCNYKILYIYILIKITFSIIMFLVNVAASTTTFSFSS